MADRDLAPRKPARQLAVVIALDDIARFPRPSCHRDPQHVGRARAAVDQIADEDRLAALRRRDGDGTLTAVSPHAIR